MTAEAEEAVCITKPCIIISDLLTNKFKKSCRPVKDNDRNTLKTKEEQMKRWIRHFKDDLNQQPPTHDVDIHPATEQLPIYCNQPTMAEISKAINILKNNKSLVHLMYRLNYLKQININAIRLNLQNLQR